MKDRDFTNYLNQVYSEMSEDEAIDKFIYLTNPRRMHRTTENNIRKQYRLGKLGSLLKSLDSIGYEVAKKDQDQ